MIEITKLFLLIFVSASSCGERNKIRLIFVINLTKQSLKFKSMSYQKPDVIEPHGKFNSRSIFGFRRIKNFVS